jgi:hypothetical protein
MLQLYKNYKPMRFFGTVGAVLLIAALILMAPVFAEYLKTGLVPRFPTLIAGGFIGLAGLQSFFGGVILEVLAAKDRRDFEYRLVQISMQKRGKEA